MHITILFPCILMWVCYVTCRMPSVQCDVRHWIVHVQCLNSAVHNWTRWIIYTGVYTHFTHAYRPFSVRHWLRNVYVWKWITNQLVMIFLNHRCYCHLGIPRIVSAKYEVILRLATMFIFVREVSSRRRRRTKNLTISKRFPRYHTKT